MNVPSALSKAEARPSKQYCGHKREFPYLSIVNVAHRLHPQPQNELDSGNVLWDLF